MILNQDSVSVLTALSLPPDALATHEAATRTLPPCVAIVSRDAALSAMQWLKLLFGRFGEGTYSIDYVQVTAESSTVVLEFRAKDRNNAHASLEAVVLRPGAYRVGAQNLLTALERLQGDTVRLATGWNAVVRNPKWVPDHKTETETLEHLSDVCVTGAKAGRVLKHSFEYGTLAHIDIPALGYDTCLDAIFEPYNAISQTRSSRIPVPTAGLATRMQRLDSARAEDTSRYGLCDIGLEIHAMDPYYYAGKATEEENCAYLAASRASTLTLAATNGHWLAVDGWPTSEETRAYETFLPRILCSKPAELIPEGSVLTCWYRTSVCRYQGGKETYKERIDYIQLDSHAAGSTRRVVYADKCQFPNWRDVLQQGTGLEVQMRAGELREALRYVKTGTDPKTYHIQWLLQPVKAAAVLTLRAVMDGAETSDGLEVQCDLKLLKSFAHVWSTPAHRVFEYPNDAITARLSCAYLLDALEAVAGKRDIPVKFTIWGGLNPVVLEAVETNGIYTTVMPTRLA